MEFPFRSFTFTAAGQTLDLPGLHGPVSRAWLQVIGTGVLTLVVEDSYDDGVTYNVVQALDLSTDAISPIDHAGMYTTREAPFKQPRVRCSAFTSGGFTVFARAIPMGRDSVN